MDQLAQSVVILVTIISFYGKSLKSSFSTNHQIVEMKRLLVLKIMIKVFGQAVHQPVSPFVPNLFIPKAVNISAMGMRLVQRVIYHVQLELVYQASRQ